MARKLGLMRKMLGIKQDVVVHNQFTFTLLDKLMKAIEENKKLYEALL